MLKVGDRCIVVHSPCGLDEGKIVDVTGYFSSNGGIFDKWIWTEGMDVIVTAIDSPLHSVNQLMYLVDVHTSRPYASAWLRKLPKVEDKEEDKVLEVVR